MVTLSKQQWAFTELYYWYSVIMNTNPETILLIFTLPVSFTLKWYLLGPLFVGLLVFHPPATACTKNAARLHYSLATPGRSLEKRLGRARLAEGMCRCVIASGVFTPRACARGKAICLSSSSSQKSPGLEFYIRFCACCNYHELVNISAKNWFLCVSYC